MGNTAKLIAIIVVFGLMTLSGVFTIDTTDNATTMRTLGVFIAAWLSLIIFSFLYSDNPFYRAAEHVMVGLAMGYFAVYYMFAVLKPRFWDRLVNNDLLPDQMLFGSAPAFRWALLIPAALGILMLTRVSQKIGWLSRWSIAAMIGISSGYAIPTMLQANVTTQLEAAVLLPQTYVQALYGGTNLPGYTSVPWWEVGVPILIIGTVCALVYFFFSVPHRGVIGGTARIGILVLMVGFGASFGYTVMARLSLLIGRILFLLKDWLGWLG